jgi:hypothetical protein
MSRGRPYGMIEMQGMPSAASLAPTNAPSNHTARANLENLHSESVQDVKKNDVPFTTSQLLEQRQFAEYQKFHTRAPIQERAKDQASPGLPPSIPSHRFSDSPKRSESSSLSRSGRACTQRSTSVGCAILQPGELVHTIPQKPPRSRDSSPKPPRQSIFQNSVELQSPLMSGGGCGTGVDGGKQSPVGSGNGFTDKPQLRRRPSVDLSESTRHRRSHSADVPRGERLRRNTSNSSLTSYALNSEALKMLPDPRWGGGVTSFARSRSFSSENLQSMVKTDVSPYSSDDSSNPYGSIMGTDNKDMINSVIESTPIVDQQPKLQLSRSEISISSYSSGVSVDRSVEPVMTDMTKSAMFKGVTNKGIVKLQLPKDNFRLLSDRDLGESDVSVF